MLITIIIRGVAFKVTQETAKELQQLERELIQKEWNTNQLGE